MKIIEYFKQTDKEKEYWRKEICKGDWTAAKYLYKLLDRDRLHEMCGDNPRLLLLIEDNRLISFCTLTETDEIKADDMKPWIGFVYTFSEYRGNRYSEKIIKHAIKLAEQDGNKYVYISSNEIGLYEKYGFVFLKNMKNIWDKYTQVFVYNIN